MSQSQTAAPASTSITGRLVLVSVALVVGSVGILLAYLMLLLRLNMLIMAFSGFVYWVLPGVHVSREELARGTEEIVEKERVLEHLDEAGH